ncbi:DUF3630 family protein [Oceanisphaera pacifica]|uniref:DUF3630 family protein n=1 Tax=Oceanisphaera pacifica TaxID=2818389 RepID=A0ABS3NJS5_9GAMM|nr:DUF3630 family protein [Oceanisphaera pacifica]MBO1520545.1 DUF3630 family protein [Oceanisphaera pacifica]
MTKTILTTTQPLTFTHFAPWAEGLIRELELEVIEREQGADYHQWLLCFEGCQLFLCFQHYADCAWLQPVSTIDQDVADWLTQQWNRQMEAISRQPSAVSER